MIFFSIIISVFNNEDLITRAVNSVLNQKFDDYELLIVNDGSSDNTPVLIKNLADKNNKIKIITHEKNESLHVSRMDGVSKANGKYILFLDGDDYYTNNALSILYKEIQKNPDCDLYEFGYLKKPSNKKAVPSFLEQDRFSSYLKSKKSPTHTMWNKVYDSQLIKKAFSVMERTYLNYVEDIYESIIISFFTKKTYLINKIIINYSIATGISNTYKDYNKLIIYLKSMHIMQELLTNFLISNNVTAALDNINFKLLKYVINNYVHTQKNESDVKKAYLLLPEYFDINIIIDYLYQRDTSLKKMDFISKSFLYKLYRFLSK